jgi:AP-1-like factor
MTISCGEGAAFPKTIKSDKNIEVLTAWKSITSDPKFKDVDISSLCSEFTNKARCDGSQVVLEPQGVHSILETLSNKQQ